jgi:hypothetical protein
LFCPPSEKTDHTSIGNSAAPSISTGYNSFNSSSSEKQAAIDTSIEALTAGTDKKTTSLAAQYWSEPAAGADTHTTADETVLRGGKGVGKSSSNLLVVVDLSTAPRSSRTSSMKTPRVKVRRAHESLESLIDYLDQQERQTTVAPLLHS